MEPGPISSTVRGGGPSALPPAASSLPARRPAWPGRGIEGGAGARPRPARRRHGCRWRRRPACRPKLRPPRHRARRARGRCAGRCEWLRGRSRALFHGGRLLPPRRLRHRADVAWADAWRGNPLRKCCARRPLRGLPGPPPRPILPRGHRAPAPYRDADATIVRRAMARSRQEAMVRRWRLTGLCRTCGARQWAQPLGTPRPDDDRPPNPCRLAPRAGENLTRSSISAATRTESTAWRRDFHAHPETASRSPHRRPGRRAAGAWGIEVHRGIGRTGVVGVLRSGHGNRAVGLRADMDALRMQEANGFAHRAPRPARCMAAAMTATPPCCWARPATWPRRRPSTASSISSSSRPRRARAAPRR